MQAAALPETHYSVVSYTVNYLHACSKLNTLTGCIQDTAANESNKLHAKVRGLSLLLQVGIEPTILSSEENKCCAPQHLLHYHLATGA